MRTAWPRLQRPSSRSSSRRKAPSIGAAALAALIFASPVAFAEALPAPIARALQQAGVPLDSVAIVVQRIGEKQPRIRHQPDVPMNPASVMKLVTTYAALDLLGPQFRWRTEAYLGGPLEDGVLHGDLVLRGSGDPKITIEQWQSLMRSLVDAGVQRIDGDLVLDRSRFDLPAYDPGRFDAEPLRPYNVGPDALLVNFKTVRFRFAANGSANGVELKVEPPLPQLAVAPPPALVSGGCTDWRRSLEAAIIDQPRAAAATFPGTFATGCGTRDWSFALLDHANYVHGMFATYFAAAGGDFEGIVRDGNAPSGELPFVTLLSPPLYDVVRDVNKFSNNVMARQLFLTLASERGTAPATPAAAARVVADWLAKRRIAMPGLVIENGSGLSRDERATAGGLIALLASADRSVLRNEFASSLAVAATDGTLERRLLHGRSAGNALLKTGSLEGVRALAGYVIDRDGERWMLAAIVNHPNAQRAVPALDALVEWIGQQSHPTLSARARDG